MDPSESGATRAQRTHGNDPGRQAAPQWPAKAFRRQIVRRAIELDASALILVHNHPSGDPTPSAEDIELTEEIVKVSASLGITLHDHIIIGRGCETSLRRLGYIGNGSGRTLPQALSVRTA